MSNPISNQSEVVSQPTSADKINNTLSDDQSIREVCATIRRGSYPIIAKQLAEQLDAAMQEISIIAAAHATEREAATELFEKAYAFHSFWSRVSLLEVSHDLALALDDFRHALDAYRAATASREESKAA